MPGMRESSPSPLSFSSLGLPISINNNNGGNNNNNNNNTSVDLNRSRSPDRDMSPALSYRSPSPQHYHNSMPQPPLATPSYNDIRSYAESGHMYRRQPSPQRYEEDRDSEKDSGLALNLATDRAGSDGTRDESGRS